MEKMGIKKVLLLINDIIIFIFNVVISIILFSISNKEKTYRGSSKLFINQIIISIIIIILDLILNIKNLLSSYRGHNKYGMMIRFINFYLIIACVTVTYQRGNNLNHDDIKNLSNLVFYFGFVNNGLIISSMILSFIVIDIKKEDKILVYKNRKSINLETVGNTKLLEETNIDYQIFQENEKKEE